MISPFQEVIESKGLHLFCEHETPGFVDVAREFYPNMVGIKDKIVYVKGKWIFFSREQIDQTYNLYEMKKRSKCDAPKPGGPLITRQPSEYS